MVILHEKHIGGRATITSPAIGLLLVEVTAFKLGNGLKIRASFGLKYLQIST